MTAAKKTHHHLIDAIPLGGIVTVRDRLLEMQAQGKKILRLESGDPSFGIPEHVREALEKALRDGHTHYTAGAGIPQLREAACEKMRQQNKLPVKGPGQVLVTSGAMHGLYVAFRAILGPGDEAIIPDPTWTETADNITLAGAKVVRARLDPERGYLYDAAAIEKVITKRTRLIVLNTPHNPTGAVLKRETLGAILQLAHAHDLYVLADEAYEHVIYDDLPHVSIGSLPGAEDRVVSIYSMSKSFAMSGLRLGYLTANDDRLIERMTKLLRCTVNGVNSATQHAGVAALKGPADATRKMAAVYRERRDLLFASLEKIKCFKPFKPAGAFYAWVKIGADWQGYQGKRDGWAMTNYLIDKGGVGSAPGDVFGPAGAGHVRFAFSCPTEQIAAAAEILPTLF
ncbi:MAG: pyridoxal phosphate-dependent aminotransferase [Deltaproteobacteria bacterium]|nr:pyridoxal phosphate-dependent aminotransferase [Deltaproteobacteria bacterium]